MLWIIENESKNKRARSGGEVFENPDFERELEALK